MLGPGFGRVGQLPVYLAFALWGATLMGASPDPLKPLQWKARVLVVSAPKHDDSGLMAQDAILKRDLNGQAERDLKIIRVVGAEAPAGIDAQALRERLSLPPDRFEVVLVGKDGTTVLRMRQPISLDDLFYRIDAMPMRRDEIRRQTPPSTDNPQ